MRYSTCQEAVIASECETYLFRTQFKYSSISLIGHGYMVKTVLLAKNL